MVRGLKGCNEHLFLLVIFVAIIHRLGLNLNPFLKAVKKKKPKLVNNGHMGPCVCYERHVSVHVKAFESFPYKMFFFPETNSKCT